MKAIEICNLLLNNAAERHEPTCDIINSGDGGREVKKAATCFKATAEVVAKAIDEGVDLLIMHEPLYSREHPTEEKLKYDKVKKEMIDKSGIVIFRYHDHAHLSEPDFIHEGYIRTLGLDCTRLPGGSFGVLPYELAQPTTVRGLAKLSGEKLGVKNPHIIGDPSLPVKKVMLGLGWVNSGAVERLLDSDCDVMVTGENNEVFDCEYMRDAVYFGAKKAIIMLGHCGSEYAGMRYLAEWMTERIIPTEYIHCGGLYRTAEDDELRMR